MPVTLPAQSRQYRLILWRAKLNKITDTPSALAPLFPVAHADTSAQPMIHFNYVVVLHPDSEIIHPSMDVEAKGCIPVVHGDTPTAPGKAAQPALESIDSFLSGSKFHPLKGETQKGTVLSTDNFTFVPVHLYLKNLLKETADTCHHTLTGTFRLYQYRKVSRPRELPPQALSELYVNVSAHTAPIIQPVTQDPASSEQISLVLAD